MTTTDTATPDAPDTATHELLLQLQGVQAGYDRKIVLESIDLEVRRGAVTALVGPNGSGKTTLLRCVLGLLKPRAGRIVSPGGRWPRIGYVPQTDISEVTFPVTSLEVALMGLTPRLGLLRRPGPAHRALTLAALGRFGVADLAPRPFRSLSGGQRQRVLLARALVGEPELLVLDEPVRGLDLASSAVLVAQIVAFAKEQGLGVLVATHSLDIVANHADIVALFRHGHAEVGPAGQIFTDEVLTRFHDHPVKVREVEGQRVVLPGAPRPGEVLD